MIRGLYSAASALDTAAMNQEITAENLAHVTTPGYRRQGLLFESYTDQYQPEPTDDDGGNVAAVRSNGAYTSFEIGPLQQTGNPLDLALAGDAFFVLEGPEGPLYTRNGCFQISANGDLVAKNGLRVRGQGGPVQIPSTVTRLNVSPDGVIYADNLEVGRLQLAQFANPRDLQRAGDSHFSGGAPQVPALGTVRVEQGYREGANVQVVNEMVTMMMGYRHYDAADRALRALSDSVSLNTRPQ